MTGSPELHPRDRNLPTGLCAPQHAGPLGPLEQACDESPSSCGRYIASAYGRVVSELHREANALSDAPPTSDTQQMAAEHLRRVAADLAVTGALYVRAAGRGGK